MGVFSRLFEPRESETARFERIEAKIRDLDDILTKQGKSIKALELDWDQTYDKMKHLMARITKRRAALDAEQQAQEDAPEAPGRPNARAAGDNIIGTHDALQEMRRRNGLLPR
jgi:uncharacterized coiled-coil protein SlyX